MGLLPIAGRKRKRHTQDDMPLVCNTEPVCKALICCGEDSFENYSAAGSDAELFFNQEVSYTSQCPPQYNCITATVTIPANANKPATNNPPTAAQPPGPAPCLGPFTGATQAEANAAALACAQAAANAQTVITGPRIFYNTEQTLECPEGYAGGPFTVPAGTVASMTSQAHANAQALAIAQGLADEFCVASECNGCLTPDGTVEGGDRPASSAAGPVSGSALEDYIFVANADGQTVSIIDFATKTEIVQVLIGSDTRVVTYVESNNRVYVVATGGIYVIDPTTFGLSGPIALPGGLVAADLGLRGLSVDVVNSRLYIIADATGVDGSKHHIVSIDTTNDTASILVTLPADTPAVDFSMFGERVAHATGSNLIYVFYLFVDLVDGSNDQKRIKVYDDTGAEVDEIVIADGDAFSSDYVPMYYFPEKDRVYAVGEMGDTAVGSLKVINPATNTVVANISSSVFNTGSMDLNVDQDLLVYQKQDFPNNILVCIQATSNTVTCTRLIDSELVTPTCTSLATIEGVTFIPRSKWDDCAMFICDGDAPFINTAQTVECPMGETGGPFTVPAGVYSASTQSQANALALADAQAQADAGCQSCVDNPVSALVWTLTGDCASSSAAGGSATLTVTPPAGPGLCSATATLIGSCNEYTLDIEITSYTVGTTSFADGPSGSSRVEVLVDGNSEFLVEVSPGDPGICTSSTGGPTSVTHLIPAGVGTHALELKMQNGSITFPPGPCTCTATFSLTPLTPP